MKRQFKIIVLFAFLIFNNSNAQSNSKTETLKINWPKEEGWHIVDQQNNAEQTTTMIVFLKGKETIPNYTELATTYISHDFIAEPLENKIEEIYQGLKKSAPRAIKTIIEKDEKAEYPWIICKIEAPLESQIYYAIQGKNEVYFSLWSPKQGEITPKSQEKWVEIFKSSKIILE